MKRPKAVVDRLQYALADRRIRRQVGRVEAWLREYAPEPTGRAPVLFFNASTRIHHLSLNGAFSRLAAWALHSTGTPVIYLVCQRGMEQCMLGTNADRLEQPPPCELCIRYSEGLFPADATVPLTLDVELAAEIEGQLRSAPLEQLVNWTADGLPLGQLCLPGLRWALRRHDLADDPATRAVYRKYLASARSLADSLDRILEETDPASLVLFNGIMYPEAVARAVAGKRGIPTVTHEVGLKPYSAFFSHQEATFREIVPHPLTPMEDRALDGYLEARRQGKFSMAGIRFWPELKSLPERVADSLSGGRQLVTVFTNVVFDTSQVHANTLYDNMFSWLEDVAQAIPAHRDTLFVVRAHPDENRPGKASRQTVADWFDAAGLKGEPNALFVGPDEYVSSYELIEHSKFVTVYSSSIGLEASILGVPVLCAGRARYTQVKAVDFPGSADGYRQVLAEWLAASQIEWPAELQANARAFLHFELNHASLGLGEFLAPYPVLPGMVEFSDFAPGRLAQSEELGVIRGGILEGLPFTLEMPSQMEPA